jgi:hypothetical protein
LAEGTGRKKGGAVKWQGFNEQDKPTAEKGQTADLSVWSLPAACANADGGFAVIY